jgi:hypothetical protein
MKKKYFISNKSTNNYNQYIDYFNLLLNFILGFMIVFCIIFFICGGNINISFDCIVSIIFFIILIFLYNILR